MEGQQRGSKYWTDLLKEAGKQLVPIVISTGSLLGFIAFAGAVVAWTRLNAVEVAPDQAIVAFPRSELIAMGASLLLLFGSFGALAVLGVFLIDRGGRPTQGMAYGLLALVGLEGLALIAISTEFLSFEWVTATLCFLLPLAFAAWLASLGTFSELRDELPGRETELRGPLPRSGLMRPDNDQRVFASRPVLFSCLAAFLAVAGSGAVLIANHSLEVAFAFATFGGAAFLLAVAAVLHLESQRTDSRRTTAERNEQRETARLVAREEEWTDSQADVRSRERLENWQKGERRAIEDLRIARRRPYRLYLTWKGTAAIVAALTAAAVLPALVVGEIWLGVSVAVAVVLAMWLWRIAIFTREKIVWLGLAVFLSVPLFGVVMTTVRNLADPQIQPLALIRSSDRADEAIQGLYVTEAKDRVYFATVATDGCDDDLMPNSGRLLWVPKDEVVAMSIGPSQSVQDAAKTSLEMAYALTPAVETPAGDSVSLTAGEMRSEEGGLGEEAPLTVQRLENVGSAIRRTFGGGVRLDPEQAGPGDEVRLTMRDPVGDGFGARREQKNVRVGGVPAEIVVNPVLEARRAEFVKTVNGKRLKLEKGAVYGQRTVMTETGEETEMVPWYAGLGVERYVRLKPGQGIVGTSDGGEDEENLFLKLTDRGVGAERPHDELQQDTEITFQEKKQPAKLAPTLYRQAWNEDEIKFVVPEKGSTGTVTVDCAQLAGEPLLRLDPPPQAGFAVRMAASGQAVALDGRRSGHDGEIKARRWALDGDRLRPPRARRDGKKRSSDVFAWARLPLRLGTHRIRLTVRDGRGEIDTASAYVLRVPRVGGLLNAEGEGDERTEKEAKSLKRLSDVLGTLVQSVEPTEIWVDGHSGSASRKGLLKGARAAVTRLMNREVAENAGLADRALKVRLRGFEDRCGVVPSGSGRRAIDLWIVDAGVRVLPPVGCSARTFAVMGWPRAKTEEKK